MSHKNIILLQDVAELPSESLENFADDHQDLLGKSSFDLWKLYFSNDLLTTIVTQTNLYACTDKNDQDFKVSISELCRFLGIHIFSGYQTVPSERDYWSNQHNLRIQLVSEALSSKRYLKIKALFHLVDYRTLTSAESKIAKVLPLYDSLNASLIQFGIFDKNLSVDGSMVPHFGRHSCKMFIRGKPIRFGYKLLCLCGSNSYPYKLSIYTGKVPNSAENSAPLGKRDVKKIVNIIEEHSQPAKHSLFFDNLFTSYRLCADRTQRDIKFIGTVHENRSAGACKAITSSKKLSRSNRGSFDYRSDSEVFFCKWNDNSSVNIASNFATHQPLQKVLQKVKRNPNTSVDMPMLVKPYNNGMGGVDVMDQLLGSYRQSIRGKKWYWPLVINGLKVSVGAAWHLHCALAAKPMSHFAFRREIALCLLKTLTEFLHSKVTGVRVSHLSSSLRFDGLDHTTVTCT